MTRRSWQFWGLLAGTYVLLMSPIVGLVIIGHINRDPNFSLVSLVTSAAYVLWLPLYVALAMVLIWNMAPLGYWIAWKTLLAIEWITGMQVGTRFGERIILSSYFKHSKQGWPAQWLYRRALARMCGVQTLAEKLQKDA
jgi:hypothetical protein